MGQAVERRNAYLDLRELVLHVVRVHRLDLLTRGGTEHLDDLDELVDSAKAGMKCDPSDLPQIPAGKPQARGENGPRLSREQRLTEHQLRHDTARRPDVCEMGHERDQFRVHPATKRKPHSPMLVV